MFCYCCFQLVNAEGATCSLLELNHITCTQSAGKEDHSSIFSVKLQTEGADPHQKAEQLVDTTLILQLANVRPCKNKTNWQLNLCEAKGPNESVTEVQCVRCVMFPLCG